MLAACAAVPRAADAVRGLVEADNRGDFAAAVGTYTPDAVWLPPSGEAVRGRDAIAERYRSMFATYAPHLTITIVDEQPLGDAAVVRGTTRGELVAKADGATTAVHDEFTAVLRRIGDRWCVAQLRWQPVAR